MKNGTRGSTLPGKLVASAHPARLWRPADNGSGGVICELSPRHCRIADGGLGFCQVRRNDGGRLVSLNYGKAVQNTREVIEAEAVWHYAPGEPILSVGNIGCNLHCDFCHNWRTSQAALADDADIELYTPESIVRAALDYGLRVISWTYDDPVVWHEFVLDAARLARQHGLRNVYKSAFYITEQAVDELLDVIDVFSVSIKSLDPTFYRRFTRGQLEPVLAATEQVARSGRHLEISNLMVTGRNDNLDDAARVAAWVRDHLGPRVPLHYVGFHPDYRYTRVERTPVEVLHAARAQALAMGLRHVYTGNVLDGPGTETRCDCGAVLIERYGLTTRSHLTADGTCAGCGARPDLVLLPPRPEPMALDDVREVLARWPRLEHPWRPGIACAHVDNPAGAEIFYQAIDSAGQDLGAPVRCAMPRFLIGRSQPAEAAVRLYHQGSAPLVLDQLDRAYYPLRRGATRG